MRFLVPEFGDKKFNVTSFYIDCTMNDFLTAISRDRLKWPHFT
ncbi:hypothetical protein [Oligoflexus tunisiensis]|nr:hypothetical protein [Oligoflexus tunisiensis]